MGGTPMTIILLSIILYFAAALSARRRGISYAIAFVASLAVIAAGIWGILSTSSPVDFAYGFGIVLSWGIDNLSGLFLIFVGLSGALLSLFAIDYGRFFGRRTATAFSLAFASILVVFTARDTISFLFSWELVTIFVFLMIIGDSASSETQSGRSPMTSAAFRFLLFGEISFALLLLTAAASFALSGSAALEALPKAGSAVLFLGILGAAIKFDTVPFHVWMPRVYEHTSDHTSAFLSVPLTLMGVYALERFLFLGTLSPTLLLILVLLGAFSAFWGALHAAGSRTLKSLPAYSTVEANGMILAAAATAALAREAGGPSLTYLSQFAEAAALTIAFAHGIAKTLLFMSIGHAKEFLGVRTIDETRGVWRTVGRIPGLGIFMSSLSLAAMPPFLGYTGEWMLLETFFQSSRFRQPMEIYVLIFAGVILALAIGLTVFAMVKLIGYTALGYHHGIRAPERSATFMKAAQGTAIVLIPLLGLALPFLLIPAGFGSLFNGLLGVPSPLLLNSGDPLFGVLSPTMFGIIVAVLALLPLVVWRHRSTKTRKVPSWYGGITMEENEFYSEPAFSQILLHQFRRFYGAREIAENDRAQIHHRDRLIAPLLWASDLVRGIGAFFSRYFMHGKVNYYVLYIFLVFLVILLLPI